MVVGFPSPSGEVKRLKLQLLQRPIAEAAGIKPGQTVMIKRRVPVLKSALQRLEVKSEVGFFFLYVLQQSVMFPYNVLLGPNSAPAEMYVLLAQRLELSSFLYVRILVPCFAQHCLAGLFFQLIG